MPSADELKEKGNELFVKGFFDEAMKCYTEAIDTFGPSAVLLTNRAAANIGLSQFVQAREDATAAIELDCTFVKAYYRKASVEQKLGMEKAAFETWMACSRACEPTAWLRQQLKAAVTRWVGCFKKIPINDDTDFMERYVLLPTSREKLSTMAHFWNESAKSERLSHFHFFLQLVGNSPDIAEVYRAMRPEQMPDMPMHNYADLPIEDLPAWRNYFTSLTPALKTGLLKSMYSSLNSKEQGLVIQDLSVFIKLATQRDVIEQAKGAGAGVGGGALVPSSSSGAGGSGGGNDTVSSGSRTGSGSGSGFVPSSSGAGVDPDIANFVHNKHSATDEEEAAEVARSLADWKNTFGRKDN